MALVCSSKLMDEKEGRSLKDIVLKVGLDGLRFDWE
jgi:hypothetical protein